MRLRSVFIGVALVLIKMANGPRLIASETSSLKSWPLFRTASQLTRRSDPRRVAGRQIEGFSRTITEMEPMPPKDISMMNAAELEAHIKERDEQFTAAQVRAKTSHRLEQKDLNALLKIRKSREAAAATA